MKIDHSRTQEGQQIGGNGRAASRRSLGPVTTRRAGYIVFASLVAPLLLLVESVRTGSRVYKHWLLTAFVTMYGATIYIDYGRGGAGSDGVRHLALVYDHYVGMGFGQFMTDIYYILTFQSASDPGIRDLYKHIVSYIAGGIFGAPQLFFIIVAFVYGYFFTGSLLEIFRHVQWRRVNYVVFGLIAMLFLVKNIEGINTVRTWTGLWVLVYASLRYYATKDRKYILLMITPPLIHFGYFIMLLPALAVLLFGNQVKIYAAIFVISSFTTFFNPGDIVEVIETTGERGEAAVSSYLMERQLTFQERVEFATRLQTRWWNTFRWLGIQKWALNVLIYTLLAAGVYFSLMSYRQKSLFSIGLLTLALSNMSWFLFAVSQRSWIIGCMFVLAAVVMVRTDPATGPRLIRSVPAFYTWGVHLSLLLFVPFFLYNLSTIMDYISAFMFIAPFLVWFNPDVNMSIKYVLQVLLGLR